MNIALMFAVAALFSDGKSDWCVVAGENPPAEVAYAAAEFTNAVFRVSGAAIPVVAASDRRDAVVEIVAKGPDRTDIDEKLGYRTKDGRLTIVGNQPRAALHATYQFLQRELGVRWIGPGAAGEIYPPRETYELPAGLRYAHVPTIRYRGFHICGGDYRREEVYRWMARNCATIHRHGVCGGQEKYGFYSMIGGHDACLHPKYFQGHPEWFSEFAGVRTPDNLCFASDGAFEKVIEELERNIRFQTVDHRTNGRRNPGILDIYSIFPSDTQRYCQCRECAKRSVSDNWFAYYNRIVARLRKAHPDMSFSTLAYQGYRDVPTDVRPDALFVEFATHGRCNAHVWGDTTCEHNVSDYAKLNAWRKTGVPMGEYGYELKTFLDHVAWVPNFTVLDDLVSDAVNSRQVSLIPESAMAGSKSEHPEIALNMFRNRFAHHFLMAKMYDGGVKLDAWMDDVTRAAFGPAAEPVRDYFRLMDRTWSAMTRHPRLASSSFGIVQHVLAPEVRTEAKRLLEAAERATAKGPEVFRLNVKREQELFAQWEEILRLRNGEGDDFAAPPERTLVCYIPTRCGNLGPADRVRAKESGWNLVICTNAVQALDALPKAKHVWFRYCHRDNVPPELLTAVRAKVKAGGAWLLSSFWDVPLSDFTGESSWGCVKSKLEKLPAALSKPVTVRPGAWQTKPHDLTRTVRDHVTPSYALKGTGPGWTDYLTAKGKETPEDPYLTMHPYGKGMVVLMGDNLHFPLCKLLENIIQENIK